MAAKVDLYNNAYSSFVSETYAKVRVETYGQDFGQTSWVTTEESAAIPNLLELSAESNVLEIGCGSGAYAVHLVESIGCRLTGLDINAAAIETAGGLSALKGLQARAHFRQCDVSAVLPFPDMTFDAVFANDAMCHLPARAKVLAECYRVLKPGGRLLYSDALVIGGLITHEEIASRSSIGTYVFCPPGENERLLEAAGFEQIVATDTTRKAMWIADRWRSARERYKEDLVATEGNDNYEGLQRFLSCVFQLLGESRLLRYLYVGRRSLQ
jgi:ubiquinone/menaquinone biosynthesis C-methylase UbiE